MALGSLGECLPPRAGWAGEGRCALVMFTTWSWLPIILLHGGREWKRGQCTRKLTTIIIITTVVIILIIIITNKMFLPRGQNSWLRLAPGGDNLASSSKFLPQISSIIPRDRVLQPFYKQPTVTGRQGTLYTH